MAAYAEHSTAQHKATAQLCASLSLGSAPCAESHSDCEGLKSAIDPYEAAACGALIRRSRTLLTPASSLAFTVICTLCLMINKYAQGLPEDKRATVKAALVNAYKVTVGERYERYERYEITLTFASLALKTGLRRQTQA